MKNEEKKVLRGKRAASSIALYIAGTVVALIAIAALVNNIRLYTNNVNSYVSQGYPAADVAKQLIPSFLLPGLFETVAVYGGIACLLFFAGIINQKVHQCLALLAPEEALDNEIEECKECIKEDTVQEDTTTEEAIIEEK